MTKGFLTTASAMVIAAVASPVMAQSAPTAPQESATEDSTGVADIVVTAQRREERLGDVPLAVTALGTADLDRNRITDMSRLQFAAPGLTFGKQGSDFFPAIRGVRTLLVSVASDPVIGFYLDGIYQSRVSQQSFPLFDLQRVEVQRGPQGLLFGRNTFGGNIAVVSKQHTPDFGAGVNAQLGNYNLRQVDGYVNLPLGDSAGLRVSGYHSQRDGYLKSATTPGIELNDDNQSAVRAVFDAEPAPGLKVILRAAYWHRDTQGGGAFAGRINGTLIDPATGLRTILGKPYLVNPTVRNGTVLVAGVDVGVAVTSDPLTNSWDYKPFEKLHETNGSAEVSYDLGPVTLKSITGLSDFFVDRSADLDQTSVIFPAAGVSAGFVASSYQAQETRDKAFSQELQLASNGSGPFQYIFGGFYFNDHVIERYRQVYTSPGAVTNNNRTTQSTRDLVTKAYAAYGQASYAIVPDQFKLTVGARYSKDTKTFKFTNQTAAPGTEKYDVTTAQAASGAPSFDKLTWRVGVDFTPQPGTLFYASVSTGFESGGFNDNSSNPLIPVAYAPQTVTAYEIGNKNRFAGGRVTLDLSAFYNDYKNLQITVLDRLTNLSYTQSAGAGRAYGLEAEMRTVPVEGLHIDGTLTLMDAKYTNYTRPNPFHVTGGSDGVEVNLAGNQIPLSPTLKTTLSVYYDVPVGEGRITPRVNWLYSSSYYATDYNTVLDYQGSYHLFDASIRYTAPNDRAYLEAFVDNIGNEIVLYAGTTGSSARVQVNYGPPRFFGARAGFKF